jgi:hypothetical protein
MRSPCVAKDQKCFILCGNNFGMGKVILCQMWTKLTRLDGTLNFWWVRSLKASGASISTAKTKHRRGRVVLVMRSSCVVKH